MSSGEAHRAEPMENGRFEAGHLKLILFARIKAFLQWKPLKFSLSPSPDRCGSDWGRASPFCRGLPANLLWLSRVMSIMLGTIKWIYLILRGRLGHDLVGRTLRNVGAFSLVRRWFSAAKLATAYLQCKNFIFLQFSNFEILADLKRANLLHR